MFGFIASADSDFAWVLTAVLGGVVGAALAVGFVMLANVALSAVGRSSHKRAMARYRREGARAAMRRPGTPLEFEMSAYVPAARKALR